jgi:putative transposase
MVSPASRRRAVNHLLMSGFTRVCSCRVAGLSRSSSRTAPKERNPELRLKVLELAGANPRYGFRRVHALLDGVNLKAVHRIWKVEGLRVRRKPRRRIRVVRQEQPALSAANQAWCVDFAHERLENGRQARILGILDCFTRENLLLKARPSYPSFQVQEELEWLFLVHGRPQRLLSDNGPEFRALTLSVEQDFIQPGKPWQNGYIESFFGKLRDELLSCGSYGCGSELQSALDDFQEHYNNQRPHLGLGGLTPARFKMGLLTHTDQKQEAILGV